MDAPTPPIERLPRSEVAICVAIALAVAALLWVPASRVEVPDQRGAKLASKRKKLARAAPEVVLLGNSILNSGVDEALFERLTGLPTHKLAQGGSDTAYWWLVLKNIIAPAERPPRLVVVFFRDHFLTDPTFRTRAPYDGAIKEISTRDEPVLQRLAYGRPDGRAPGPTFDERRQRVRTVIEKRIRKWASRAMRRAPHDADGAIEKVFDDDRMIPGAMTRRQLAAEQASDASQFDFERRLERSFLPSMIQLCRERGIELVLVRTMRRRDLVPGMQPPALVAYIDALAGYLAREGVPLVDFTGEPRIHLEHFAAGDHFSRAGRQVFTELLAERLAPHLVRRPHGR